MASIYLYTLASTVIISLISLIGVLTISINKNLLKKTTLFLVGLSAGALLGESFLHIMPELTRTNEASPFVWLSLIGGIVVFFILEKIILWHHCHAPASHEHAHPIGKMNIIGDGLHNFIDGLIIAGAFLTNIPLGIATVIAIVAHEIPQELSDFGILIFAGYTRKKALFINFFSALLSVLGALIGLAIGAQAESFAIYILPFAAGGFIYIATADIIPELHKEINIQKSIKQLAAILLGIGLMLLLKLIAE